VLGKDRQVPLARLAQQEADMILQDIGQGGDAF